MSDDCTEPYRECVRSRKERVRRAIEENPEATSSEIAQLAGVSERTARNTIIQRGAVESFPPNQHVKLKDLFDPALSYWGHRRVRDVALALGRCSPAEAAFLYAKGLAQLARSFERRMNDHDNESASPGVREAVEATDD